MWKGVRLFLPWLYLKVMYIYLNIISKHFLTYWVDNMWNISFFFVVGSVLACWGQPTIRLCTVPESKSLGLSLPMCSEDHGFTHRAGKKFTVIGKILRLKSITCTVCLVIVWCCYCLFNINATKWLALYFPPHMFSLLHSVY